MAEHYITIDTESGEVIAGPYPAARLRRQPALSRVSSPQFLTAAELAEWGVLPCVVTRDYDPATHDPAGLTIDTSQRPVTATDQGTPKPIDELRERKRVELRRAEAQILDQVRSQYTDAERETWSRQDQEAAAWSAWEAAGSEDDAPPTPTIEHLATRRGIPIAEMVARVQQKVAAYTALAGDTVGKRQALEAQLDDENLTAEQILAIEWGDEP